MSITNKHAFDKSTFIAVRLTLTKTLFIPQFMAVEFNEKPQCYGSQSERNPFDCKTCRLGWYKTSKDMLAEYPMLMLGSNFGSQV